MRKSVTLVVLTCLAAGIPLAPPVAGLSPGEISWGEGFDDGVQGWSLSGSWTVGGSCASPTTPPNHLALHRIGHCDFLNGVSGTASVVIDTADLRGPRIVWSSRAWWDTTSTFCTPEDPQACEYPDTISKTVRVRGPDGTVGGGDCAGRSTAWASCALDLSGLARGRLTLEFSGSGWSDDPDNGASWAVDSVYLQETATGLTPTAPRAFEASALGAHVVELSWAAPGDAGASPVDSYRVTRDGAVLATLSSGDTAYRDETVSGDTTYVYRLLATNADGDSPVTLASVKTDREDPAPRYLTVTAGPRTMLSWEAPLRSPGPVVGYSVFRSVDGGPQTLVGQTTSTSFSEPGPRFSSVNYHVRAETSFGLGGAVSNFRLREVVSPVEFDFDQHPEGFVRVGPSSSSFAGWVGDSIRLVTQPGEPAVKVERPMGLAGFRATAVWRDAEVDPATTVYPLYVASAPGLSGRAMMIRHSYFRSTLPGSETLASWDLLVRGMNGTIVVEHLGDTPRSPSYGLTLGHDEEDSRVYFEVRDEAGEVLTSFEQRVWYQDTGRPYMYIGAATAAGSTLSNPLEGNLDDLVVDTFNGATGGPPPPAATATFRDDTVEVAWSGGDARVYRSLDGAAPILVDDTGPSPFVDTALVDDSRYVYTVTAVDEAGEGLPSEDMFVRSRSWPSHPAWATATAGPAAGEITVDWADDPNVDGWRVWRSSGTSPTILLGTFTIPGLVDQGLAAGSYRYSIESFNRLGMSTVRAYTGPASPVTSPTEPRTPTATPSGVGVVTVSWTPPAVGGAITHYVLRRGDGATFSTTSTSFVDNGLAPSTTYSYRISAVNAVGEGPPSAEVSVKTNGPPSVPRTVVGKSGPGLRMAQLTWQAPADLGGLPVRYEVTRIAPDGTSATYPYTGTSYLDSGLAFGTTYAYDIVALNDAGRSPPIRVTVTTWANVLPELPTGVQANYLGASFDVQVKWTGAAANDGPPVRAYRIYRTLMIQDTRVGEETLVAEVPAAARFFNDDVMPPGPRYAYRVASVNLVGERSAAEIRATGGQLP